MADQEQQMQTPQRDPTIATTEQLLREIKSSREFMETALSGVRDVIETRLNGMDKAIELLQSTTNKFPDHIRGAVQTLQELHDEKFNSIAIQFKERDTRTEQAATQSKVAIDAALQAQKEAVGEQNRSNALSIAKSEAGFTKQIDQIVVLINAMVKATDEKNDDLKDRVAKIETSSTGRINTIEGRSQGHGETWGYVIGAVGLFGAVISIFFALSKGAGL